MLLNKDFTLHGENQTKKQTIKRPVIKGEECNYMYSLLPVTLVFSFLESMLYFKN